MKAALLAGVVAGTILFFYQQLFVVPRILAAEAYEDGADEHGHSKWKPSEGAERGFFTAAGTVLAGIGYAALLLSIVTLSGFRLDVRSGIAWGLAGFACVTLAPAVGLP